MTPTTEEGADDSSWWQQPSPLESMDGAGGETADAEATDAAAEADGEATNDDAAAEGIRYVTLRYVTY